MAFSTNPPISGGAMSSEQEAYGVEISLKHFDNKWEAFPANCGKKVTKIMNDFGKIVRIIQREGFRSSSFPRNARWKKIHTPTGALKNQISGKDISEVFEARLSNTLPHRVFFGQCGKDPRRGYLVRYDTDHSALES